MVLHPKWDWETHQAVPVHQRVRILEHHVGTATVQSDHRCDGECHTTSQLMLSLSAIHHPVVHRFLSTTITLADLSIDRKTVIWQSSPRLVRFSRMVSFHRSAYGCSCRAGTLCSCTCHDIWTRRNISFVSITGCHLLLHLFALTSSWGL